MEDIKSRIANFQKEIRLDYQKSLEPNRNKKPSNIERIEWYLDEFNNAFGTNYDVGNIVKLIVENDVVAGMVRNKFQTTMKTRAGIILTENNNIINKSKYGVGFAAKEVVLAVYKSFSEEELKLAMKHSMKYFKTAKEKTNMINSGKGYSHVSFHSNPYNEYSLYTWTDTKGFAKMLMVWFDALGWDIQVSVRKEQ